MRPLAASPHRLQATCATLRLIHFPVGLFRMNTPDDDSDTSVATENA
ncbi:MAG: hypothetical protein ACI93T_002601 [Porticoccaceae bacterium]|jgi:hypothetical protein